LISFFDEEILDGIVEMLKLDQQNPPI